MNRSYLTTGLIVLLVILLALFWQALNRQQLPWQANTNQPALSFTDADITQLAITLDQPASRSADRPVQPDVVLRQQDDSWYLASDSGQVAADQTKVDQVITALLSLRRSDPASINPANHSRYQVDAGLTVTVTTAQGETVIHLGKIGPDYNSQYFRIDDEDTVYRHPRLLRSLFTHNLWTASPSAVTTKGNE